MPRPLEWLTLNFGYHTEHHLFPAMSTRHGKAVRAAIVEHYPNHYQSMPLTTALYQLYTTARVYKEDVTLTDPNTGETWPTLQPRA
jgi:fatty acid desaturase